MYVKYECGKVDGSKGKSQDRSKGGAQKNDITLAMTGARGVCG